MDAEVKMSRGTRSQKARTLACRNCRRSDAHVSKEWALNADPDTGRAQFSRAPNDKGGVDRWGVELGSPQSMARNGWRSSIVKPGDKVTVVVNPLKSGEFGGIFVSITLADGRRLGGRATD